jgi:hypothetical protein
MARLEGAPAGAPGTTGGLAFIGGPGVGGPGFAARFGARQKQVHRESTRFWPRALGTSPWGMTAWLRRNVPGAGRYRVRLIDDVSSDDLDDVISRTTAALAAGRPVPLLIGSFVPRHYVLALSAGAGAWHVYEPSGGEVRQVSPAEVRARALAPLLGFPRWHAALLPQ